MGWGADCRPAASLFAGGRLTKRGVGGGPTRGTILGASTLLPRLQCTRHGAVGE